MVARRVLLVGGTLVVGTAALRLWRELRRRAATDRPGPSGPRFHLSMDHWPPVPRAPTNGAGRPRESHPGES